MTLLFFAIQHGCKAGRYEETMTDVYRCRIQRDAGDRSKYFCTGKLGAFGAELAALSFFFERPWDEPVTGIVEEHAAFLMSRAAYALRAGGNFRDATTPTRIALQSYLKRHDWDQAATSVGQLSELSLTLGDVAAAMRHAVSGVELADRSGRTGARVSKRTMLANVLHFMGRDTASEPAFQDAEQIQSRSNPSRPLLHGTWGFKYCDLLIARILPGPTNDAGLGDRADQLHRRAKDQLRQIRDRVGRTSPWAAADGWLLEMPLEHLTLVACHIVEAAIGEHTDWLDAESHANSAVDGFHRAGVQEYVVRSLLCRAALHRLRYVATNDASQLDQADNDLTEAEQMVKRNSMVIWQIEAALERTRTYLRGHPHRDQCISKKRILLHRGHPASGITAACARATR